MDDSDHLLSLLSKMDCVLSLQREACACACFLCFDSEKSQLLGGCLFLKYSPVAPVPRLPRVWGLRAAPRGVQGVGTVLGQPGHHLWWLPVSMAARATLEQSALLLSLHPRPRAGSRRLGLPLAGNDLALSKCLLAAHPRGE